MKIISTLLVFLISCSLSSISFAGNIQCEKDNEALRSMAMSTVTFTRTDGTTLDVQARIADTGQKRSAGFQRVCSETIAKTPILFVFQESFIPSFHMNNVVSSLDIAFIRPDASIDSIQRMYPYILISIDKPLYSSSSPVNAALETYPGFFKENNIDLNSSLSWELN